MSEKFVTIQEAAELTNKSIQTIRRAIKSKKVKTRKQKTPQGFNYLINRVSLIEAYGLKITEKADEAVKKVQEEAKTEAKKTVKKVAKQGDDVVVSSADFSRFATTMEKLLNQHAEERQNFLRLVNTLQEKIFVLENQLNLLRAPQKSWYQFWK